MVRRIGGPADRGRVRPKLEAAASCGAAGNAANTTGTRTGALCATVAWGAASSLRAGAVLTEQHAGSLACSRAGCCAAGSPFSQQHDFIASGPQRWSKACALPEPSSAAAAIPATNRWRAADRIELE